MSLLKSLTHDWLRVLIHRYVYIFESLTSESLYTPKKKKNHSCLGGKLLMVRKKVISVMGLDENQ